MKPLIAPLFALFLLTSLSVRSQQISNQETAFDVQKIFPVGISSVTAGSRKLYQRNTGMIIGIQRGKYTSLELGGEAHWRKISLFHPRITGVTANLDYNPGRNVLGYHAGVWMKHGHLNLTYGADFSYFTDFNDRRALAIGPSVGFRLLGLDLVNGLNFVTARSTKTAETSLPVNTFYMSLRYYLPVKNEFTWDRQTLKRRRERKYERLKKRREKTKGIRPSKWYLPFHLRNQR